MFLGRKRAKTREEGKIKARLKEWPEKEKTPDFSRVSKSGGGGWIRTIELIEVRFTGMGRIGWFFVANKLDSVFAEKRTPDFCEFL